MHEVEIDVSEIESVYDQRNFKLMKQLQKIAGIWPYDTGSVKVLRKSVIYAFLFVTMLPLINGLRIWYGKNLDICCENVLGLVYLLVTFLKFVSIACYEEKLRKMYYRVAKNWLTLKNPEEREIMRRYAEEGRIKAIGYISTNF